MTKFKAVCFDYFGVIADDNVPHFAQTLSEHFHLPYEQIYAIYAPYNQAVNRDEITYEECWINVLHDLGRDDFIADAMDLLALDLEKLQVIPEMIELVKRLKKEQFKIGLLSNNSSQESVRMRDQGLYDCFDVILISGEIGFSKPDPAAFNLLAERLGVQTNEMIFVDDTERSLSTAEEVGFTPILFKNHDQVVKELEKLGVLSEKFAK